MKAPGFWADRDAAASRILAPASVLWTVAGRLRRALATPMQPPVPTICVGNLVAGGAGKTPVVAALVAELRHRGVKVGVLSRGHGGRERGPTMVDPVRHDAAAVGDEPLLHARIAPTAVARDRPAGARLLAEQDVAAIVMDDGLQNPTIRPSAALLVIDGAYGFGNGRVMPAGPLREPLDDALARVDAAVVIGSDPRRLAASLRPLLPVFEARIEPLPGTERFAGRRVLAFAGIGRPEKFAETLAELGAQVIELVRFPDHHRYTPDDLMRLAERAQALGLALVTTEKDATRLPPEARAMVETLPVALVWRDPGAVGRWLDGVLAG